MDNSLIDRSRMAAYADCHRLRFLQYHYAGKGLQRAAHSLPLINGDFVHKALAALITDADLDDTLEALTNAYRADVLERNIHNVEYLDHLLNEQLSLLEGLVRAWARVRLPELRAEFEVLDVEKEIGWDLAPGFQVMLRFDAVLRRKRDKLLFIKDYKTLGTIYGDWSQKFAHDSQLLCYTLAAEAVYGEPIGGLLMEGLIKGARKIEKAVTSPFLGQVIQHSPFCYAYRTWTKARQPILETTWSYKAEKVPVWELPGGIAQWLDDAFEDIDLNDFFVPLPPIKPITADQARWQRTMQHQEETIATDLLAARTFYTSAQQSGQESAWTAFWSFLDERFPMNTNHCHRYTFKYPCPMEALCFNEEIAADPLGSEQYIERIPHHTTEEDEGSDHARS